MNKIAAFAGRILLALIFIFSGANKLFDVNATELMITGAGLPPGLAVPTGLFELIGGIAIALGFMTRLFAILFAGFSVLTILFFHRNFLDPMQGTMALKNLAIAGGFLCLFAHSQMSWSYDSMRIAREGDIATRKAEELAREAELRAARAEGKASVAGTVATSDVAPGVTYVDRDGDGIPETRRRRWWLPS